MTQEEKELLLKDLCARLPYGVIVSASYKDGEGWKTEDRKILGLYEDGQVYLDCVYTTIDCIKPYLRPISSMTEEERKEYERFSHFSIGFAPILMDWVYSHHLDCCELIPKGLALEAKEGMYDTSQKWTTIRSELKENKNGQIVGGLKL